MALGDVLAGLGEASHTYHTNLLQQDYAKRVALAEKYARLAESQDYNEDQRAEFLKRAIGIHSLESGKKMPKEWENFTLTVTPPTPKPIAIPESEGRSPSSVSTEFGPSPVPYSTAGINRREVQPPTPNPYDIDLTRPIPFDERMQKLAVESKAKAAGQEGIAELRASIPKIVNTRPVQGDDGLRYTELTYEWRNPDTNLMETFTRRLETPVPFFAPRAATGAAITAGDMMAQVQAGNMLPPMDSSGTIRLNLAGVDPDDLYVPIGENRYIPQTEAQNIRSVGGQLVPVGRVTGQVSGSTIGQDTGTLPQTRQFPQIRGVDPTTGQVYVGQATATTTTQTPGPFIQQQQVAPPVPPPMGQPQVGHPGQSMMMPNVFAGIPAPAQPPLVQTPPAQPAPQVRPTGPVQPQSQVTPPAAPANPVIRPYQSVYLGQPYAYRAPIQGTVSDAGLSPGILSKEREMQFAITPAAQMLFGDPNRPLFESLEEFAPIMDIPESRERIGTAFRLIKEGLSNISSRGGPDIAVSAMGGRLGLGELTGVITNFLGLPNLIGRAEVNPIEKQMARMNETEKRMLARLIAAYGTIVGIRKITSGGAYQFATDAMEREIPVPGVTGVNDSKSYLNKLAQLAEEIATPSDMMYSMPNERKDFYNAAAIRLSIKGRAQRQAQSVGQPTLYLINGRWYDELGNIH